MPSAPGGDIALGRGYVRGHVHGMRRAMRPSRMPMPVTIRSRLLLLVLSVLLPGVLGVGWLILRTFDAEREAHERTLRETARAVSMAIDGELANRATIARVLSASRWLDGAPDLNTDARRAFEAQARRALQGTAGWVEVRGPGRVLLDTRLPEGAVPPADAPGADEPLVDVHQVLPLKLGATPADAYSAIVEPVQRQGRTLLNVRVGLMPQEMQTLIDAQSLPEGRVGAVIDNRGTVVARQPGGAAFVGRTATPDLLARMAASNEGLFNSISLDGHRTTGYFNTAPRGWTYITAMPREQFGGLFAEAVLRVALGALALLGLAVAGALWVARRIVTPVHALKHAAARVQAGQPVPHTPTGIVECDEVASALAEASEVIRHSRADLERQVELAVQRTRQAEQRVSQSQRVEALGRLTGGVAHDFNNLLGVISNSAHLMQRHPAADDLRVPLTATLRAVEVGSQLTQHLLRFAGRRPVRPQVVELGRHLPEVLELLRTVLGRRVEVSVQVAPDTWPVRVDAGELELALINLALNARDAMPSGGELRVRARNATADDIDGLPPERYVIITVSDDGQGVAPEIAARVFEPFFTTKALGKGTGLGLSQVHGFCVQAGGEARLASTPGLGTTVSMILRASLHEAPEADGLPAPAHADIAGARILLVEDNRELGDVTAALLQAHGAEVLRAASSAEALQVLDDTPQVDVVLSDVVMAGERDGLDLALHLRRQRPGLPAVLISGYSTAADASDFVVLRKPCSQADLLTALHEARLKGLQAAQEAAAK